MKTVHGLCHYESKFVENKREGWGGFDLYSTRDSAKRLVARITFWDAMGQFSFRAFEDEIPLEIVEELIAEAKREIRVR